MFLYLQPLCEEIEQERLRAKESKKKLFFYLVKAERFISLQSQKYEGLNEGKIFGIKRIKFFEILR